MFPSLSARYSLLFSYTIFEMVLQRVSRNTEFRNYWHFRNQNLESCLTKSLGNGGKGCGSCWLNFRRMELSLIFRPSETGEFQQSHPRLVGGFKTGSADYIILWLKNKQSSPCLDLEYRKNFILSVYPSPSLPHLPPFLSYFYLCLFFIDIYIHTHISIKSSTSTNFLTSLSIFWSMEFIYLSTYLSSSIDIHLFSIYESIFCIYLFIHLLFTC